MQVVAIRGPGEVNKPLGEQPVSDDLAPGVTFELPEYPGITFTTISIVHGVVRGRVPVDVYDQKIVKKIAA